MEFNADKFLKDYKRMCGYYKDCDDCPLSYIQEDCRNIENLMDIMGATSKWAEEHPAKTYLMDMKEKFPDMIIDNDFTMKYCVWRFYGENAKPKDGCFIGGCKKCWNREME